MTNFGELRRRTANFSDLRCTGERGELERETSSGRGEWKRGSVPFYRERERRRRVGQGEESMAGGPSRPLTRRFQEKK
jgi:hypothetical protein